jgi:DNA polymerase-4
MPAEVLQQMIGKTVLISGKKANGIDNNPVALRKESRSQRNTFGQDTIDIPRLKSIVGMVEKLAFQLRSEEWLTSTVVIKIRYSNFDTKQSNAGSHTLLQIIL